eukprot:698267-Pleurochrysis_carterae.AAC.2
MVFMLTARARSAGLWLRVTLLTSAMGRSGAFEASAVSVLSVLLPSSHHSLLPVLPSVSCQSVLRQRCQQSGAGCESQTGHSIQPPEMYISAHLQFIAAQHFSMSACIASPY